VSAARKNLPSVNLIKKLKIFSYALAVMNGSKFSQGSTEPNGKIFTKKRKISRLLVLQGESIRNLG
jgi:hypothetical protein